MKITGKILITALALIFVSVTLPAQEEGLDESKKRVEKRMEKVAEKLNLTEEQRTTFSEIHKKYRGKAKGIKEQTQSRVELMDLIYENKKARISEIKEILTPEQYAIYDKVDENRRGRKKKHGKRM